MKMKLVVVLFVFVMFGCESALLNQGSFSKQEKSLQGVNVSSKKLFRLSTDRSNSSIKGNSL